MGILTLTWEAQRLGCSSSELLRFRSDLTSSPLHHRTPQGGCVQHLEAIAAQARALLKTPNPPSCRILPLGEKFVNDFLRWMCHILCQNDIHSRLDSMEQFPARHRRYVQDRISRRHRLTHQVSLPFSVKALSKRSARSQL